LAAFAICAASPSTSLFIPPFGSVAKPECSTQTYDIDLDILLFACANNSVATESIDRCCKPAISPAATLIPPAFSAALAADDSRGPAGHGIGKHTFPLRAASNLQSHPHPTIFNNSIVKSVPFSQTRRLVQNLLYIWQKPQLCRSDYSSSSPIPIYSRLRALALPRRSVLTLTRIYIRIATHILLDFPAQRMLFQLDETLGTFTRVGFDTIHISSTLGFQMRNS
jgi:hypothetical protein